MRARRRGDRLHLTKLDAKVRDRVLPVARAYVDAARAAVGTTRAQLGEQLDAVPVAARDKKLAQGLRKLVADRCDYEAECPTEPAELRSLVFTRAATARREAVDGFDRDAVLDGAAAEASLDREQLERYLYADLRGEHVLRDFVALAPEQLLDEYERSQAQAVLLRAVKVIAVVKGSPDAYRLLFRTLKFRRLLHTIAPEPGGGYRIEIDGPLSLFSSVTKYGLALALALPAIQACETWKLDAVVRWGPERKPLMFVLEGSARGTAARATLPDGVDELARRLEKLDAPWTVEAADDVLDLPGVGLCVPDLRFVHRDTGEVAWLEVMGFWSREAVWRRVELVEAGLPHKLVFAVSSRLRVSEHVLDDELPACLYVYKGTMSAKAIAERLDVVFAR